MDRAACTEPQCLYKVALYLLLYLRGRKCENGSLKKHELIKSAFALLKRVQYHTLALVESRPLLRHRRTLTCYEHV